MLGFLAAHWLALEVEGLTGAAPGERSPGRTPPRNGYRDRPWGICTGTVELQVPKLRQGSSCSGCLEPRRMTERALPAVIREACVQGVSTRAVDDPMRSLGVSGISQGQVSRLGASSAASWTARWWVPGLGSGWTRPRSPLIKGAVGVPAETRRNAAKASAG